MHTLAAPTRSRTPSSARDLARLAARGLLGAGILLSSAAFAGPGLGPDGGPDHGPGPHRGGPFLHELRDLDLSEAQRTQIRGLFEARRDAGRVSLDALRDLHRRFDLAIPGSAAYGTLTTQLADAESAAVRDRVQAAAELRTQVYALLTPAQRQQLATELAKIARRPPPLDE